MNARTGQLIRLLGSTVDAEALAAVRALDRMLRAEGRDFHWLSDVVDHHLVPISNRPEWQLRAEGLLKRGGPALSPNVKSFLAAMAHWPTPPSPRQRVWLDSLAVSIEGVAA